MIDGRKVLAVITARGGSKGLPGKNVADVAGKPMVAWSAIAARQSAHVDRIILSSDDDRIMAAARAVGCDIPFRRPAHLATDTSPVAETLIHALDTIDEAFDYLVLLQATSPLRVAADIDACLQLCHRHDAPAVTVTETKPPQWMFHLAADATLRPVVAADGPPGRRQDLPPTYMLNGAVYAAPVAQYRQTRDFIVAETRAHVMPRERSVDIDTMTDLLLARAILDQHAARPPSSSPGRYP